MTTPTVVVAVHDGYYGCGTGAGYANYGFLSTLATVLPSDVRLVVLPLRLAPGSPEHHPRWYRRARKLLRRAAILPVDNGTAGQDRWGTLDNFRALVGSTADRLRELRKTAGPLLILAFDAPFLGLGAALPRDLLPSLVLVPRSSAKIHAPHDIERVRWERDGLLAAAAGGARIATISPFLAEHLRNDYHVPDESLATLRDGLVPDDWARLQPARAADLPPFVLAMGRAEPYKGFEDLLDAWEILRRADVALPRLVLAATSEQPEPTPYQRKLRRRAERLGAPVSLPTRFTPRVARLLGHRNLMAVVVPSRAEPFGRIPMESFAAGAAPVITTTQHGLAGQIIDGSTGFRSDTASPRALATALHRALSLGSDQRAAMRNRARQVALRDYDHPAAVRAFLDRHAPWLALPNPDDRLRWLNAAAPTPRSPVSTVPPVKVPIGRQAPHWTTVQAERRVLVVVHHVTSLLRLLDVLPVFGSDTRIQTVFAWNGSDPFRHGLQSHLDRLGAAVIPWAQAIETEFDLVLAANHGGLTEITDPLIVLPHGAGYTKNSPGNRKPETGNRKPETGNRKPETVPFSACLRNGCCTTGSRSPRRRFSRTTPSWKDCAGSPLPRRTLLSWQGIPPTTECWPAGISAAATAKRSASRRTRDWSLSPRRGGATR
ncbi:glycosyltransferase family 4 protein [Amycolatopsis sp. VS8301801F10]|uniref:glycosyltransferase family 4 protein n=1 Tax=Amycolatopsis sp. VS8301801F10 TaxID=2652442 RepID=UPI0038FCC11A